jgi:hypothetical protein
MRTSWILFTLLLAGCSTHPIADFLDVTQPGRMYPNEVSPYGGVCGPQGSVLAPGLTCPPPVVPVPAAPGPMGPPVVPPPVPLPGNAPAPPPPFPVAP